MQRSGRVLVLALSVVTALAFAQPASAATPVGACGPIAAPGSYVVTGPINSAGVTCITITASGVALDLNGQTISCTGGGFNGSCQVGGPGPVGIDIGPGVTGVAVMGPGTVTDFDTGIRVSSSDALIKGVTVTGPVCVPFACPRPDSIGIEVTGSSGVNLLGNDVSFHADGIHLSSSTCPGGLASCVLNGNTVHDNFSDPIPCHGIALFSSTGYTLTKNTVFANGENGFENAGIYLEGATTGNTITNNDSSNNLGFGIASSGAFGGPPSGNQIVNNTARGNTAFGGYADLGEVSGSGPNSWNNNNKCHTETGTVPATVCNPGE